MTAPVGTEQRSAAEGRTGLVARVVPVAAVPTSRLRAVVGRNLFAARHWWVVMVSGFFEPVFYLFSLGIGLGALVGEVQWAGVSVPFVEFVAPGLLAASAMNGAVFESTMNVYSRMKNDRVYDAMLQTPLQPGDVAGGEITFAQLRGTAYSAMFIIVMAVGGYTTTWWTLLALPACVLIGVAFSALGLTVTTYMRSWQDFDMIFTAVLPLFLLSTTFYPIEVYPDWARPLVFLSPLYHGVELVRAATIGVADWSILGHIAVLAGVAAVGLVVAGRRIEGLLLR